MEAIERFQKFYDELGSFFVNYEAVDRPGVKSKSVWAVVDKLSNEFEDENNHIVITRILNESRNTLLNDAKVVRVEPIEEERKVLVAICTSEEATQGVEDSQDL